MSPLEKVNLEDQVGVGKVVLSAIFGKMDCEYVDRTGLSLYCLTHSYTLHLKAFQAQ